MTDREPESSLNLGYTAREIREGASARGEHGQKGMSAAAGPLASRPATPPPAPVDRGGARKSARDSDK